MSRVPLVFASLALAVGLASPASASTAYRPPVEAPIIDPFRLPEGPFGPGNRGIEYATERGSAVRAIGEGLVVFAGPVAGQRYVTVLHPDGLRSSYGSLAEVTVTVGERVAQGQLLGRSGETVHLGVRVGGIYLDPATLFTTTGPRLVPLDGQDSPPGPDDVHRVDTPRPLSTAVWSWLVSGGAAEATGTLARRS